ncbi:malonate-semialdehyde dehydrogenase (acetylating)/methylmalonate-semialdehyde dehydrogenase [Mesocricetibacter intestinalis]|uniref:methylmalonate-semialdehyde dehydrogenase (CoA acylating) n=1 Tax=Mesocricetibacter intestinalis TaxID=1521930 RepID=A0A4R6VFD1_9PAST|nr:CoA-acylating methylmalonate-semialdehyde dehydrogenase [Mesocricetibacter intestinalis]TDQ59461.1 malonate-semialdehyde dehydrogenase (acetylating)/methylmalonate-semialdehyde dehydrogenase [Mesocricetibacter intestinalis]
METVHNFINGKHAESKSDQIWPIFNPATGKQIRQVRMSTAEDVEAATQAAYNAFPAWAATSPLKRARILFKFKELLQRDWDALARLISEEHGKVYSDACGELTRGLEVVEFACGIPHLLKGEFSEQAGTGIDIHSSMQPLGVTIGITPFNFPAMVPMWMFPISLACGNTFILKPAKADPSLSVRLAELLTEAGLPDGVFNVVHGERQDNEILLRDPRVQAVSFVGSTKVAAQVYKIASEHGKRVQALGAAKNHGLVMPDADIDSAVNAILGAAFGAAGERCMALPLVVTIDDATADKLVAALKPRVESLRYGPGIVPAGEKEMDFGPLISQQHLDKVTSYIDQGVKEGATLLVDGRGKKPKGYEEGYFIGGTLFDHVTPDMVIYKEEIFGPVLGIVRAKSFEQAMKLINEHPFGNGTAIFTADGGTAREFAYHVQAGMVGVNVPIPVPMSFHCFGGWKHSAYATLNVYGTDGVRFYTKMKTVTTRWPNKFHLEHAAFSMPTL